MGEGQNRREFQDNCTTRLVLSLTEVSLEGTRRSLGSYPFSISFCLTQVSELEDVPPQSRGREEVKTYLLPGFPHIHSDPHLSPGVVGSDNPFYQAEPLVWEWPHLKCQSVPFKFLLWTFLTPGEFLNSLQPPSEGTLRTCRPRVQELIMYLLCGVRGPERA